MWPQRKDRLRGTNPPSSRFHISAYLRLELLPKEQKLGLQETFRQYLDSRLEAYRKLPDIQAAAAGKLLLPALNNMIDMTTTRTMSIQIHPPTIVYVLLFGVALTCSLLAGYRMASAPHRSFLHVLGFAVITVVVVYVILDLDYLREGLIRLQAADQLLLKARQAMN